MNFDQSFARAGMSPARRPISCDIFCNVIDNYGDIGVSWRLARQMANEHGIAVRFIVDDLKSFAKLCPEADVALESQRCRGVEVLLWRDDFPDLIPADLVIDAFGCALPQSYLAAMTKIAAHSDRSARIAAERDAIAQVPVWINLEYLSAEDWVEGCHKLPSIKPPLTRYFFFPGFTKKTGGLLIERDLFARRDAFLSDRARQAAFWRDAGVDMPAAGTLKISLFAYENDALPDLFDAWAGSDHPVLCLVPEGRILPQVSNYFGAEAAEYARGNLSVRILPFVEQERYDELLWACDINFVRGEDSFVRAQWAGKPFVWQIYPQHDEVHQDKLQAFLDLYDARLSPAAKDALRGLWQAWNGAPAAAAQGWRTFAASLAELDCCAKVWAEELSANNLALNLLDFSQEIGRMRAFEIDEQ